MDKQAIAHLKAALEAPVMANLQAQLQTLELKMPYDIDIYMMHYRIEFIRIYRELYNKYSE